MAPHIIKLDTTSKWGVSITPPRLYSHGKEPTVPLAQDVGWAPEVVWTLWRREKISCRIETRTQTSWQSMPNPTSVLAELCTYMYTSYIHTYSEIFRELRMKHQGQRTRRDVNLRETYTQSTFKPWRWALILKFSSWKFPKTNQPTWLTILPACETRLLL
jgi:hypothetical protein